MDEQILISMKGYLQKLRRDEHQKIYAPLADCYRRTGLLTDAEDTANNGLEVFPSYLLCREVLGKVFFKRGKLNQAKEQLEKVAKIIKDSPELSRVLGKLYLQLDAKEEAARHLEFVLAKDPFDFEVHNLLIEIKRQEQALADDEMVAEQGVDMFAEPEQAKVTDIEAIINSMDEPEVKNRSDYAQATDAVFDNLESFEDDIDDKADEIFAAVESMPIEPQPKKRRVMRRDRPEIYRDKKREIKAAAVIGQIHMEIHLLDEALILSKKLQKAEPDDPDLQLLSGKFEAELDIKEMELEKLENMSFATGL